MPERKTEAIVAGATTLFLERGYDGTSLDDVAAVSGVSKTTVYNNFADKEALFARVLDGAVAPAGAIAARLREPLDAEGPLEDRLREFARRLLAGVLREDVLQLRRLAVSEAGRFPHLSAAYWERGPGTTLDLLTAAVRDLVARGELRLPDLPSARGVADVVDAGAGSAAAAAAGLLAYTIAGPPQDRALLGGPPMTPAEVEAHVRFSIAAFLVAYAV